MKQTLTALLLAGSVALNVVLAHNLRRFTHPIGSVESLQVGAIVPPFHATDLRGQTQTVTYDRVFNPTVLYVFTPPCSWCARNMDNFKTLIEKDSTHYRVIGISLSEEGLADYVANYELTVPVYSGLSLATKKAYKFSGTPQTIVVSPEGRVVQNWMGAYVGKQQKEIESFFHVTLPGLRDLSKAEATKNRGEASDGNAVTNHSER